MQNDPVRNIDTSDLLSDMSFIQKNGIVSFSFGGGTNTKDYPLFSDVFLYILIKSGEGKILINGEKYLLKPFTLVVLAPEYLCQLSDISSDLTGDILIVTKAYLDSLPASDKMYEHISNVMLRQRQVNFLEEGQCLVLSENIRAIQEKLSLGSHHLKHEIVQNTLVAFLLEVSNIWIENHWGAGSGPHQIRYEYVLKSFFNSLMQNYRNEHLIPFYAAQLNITPQYLSLIVKSLTGRTPVQFIFERLFCEARALLHHPDLSIKEVSELLHFSDQSSFGKFFKRHSGISPVDFRKRNQMR